MSEPDMPTTDECRNAYLAIQQTLDGMSVLAGTGHSMRSADSLYAEFDLWLAKVKADAWDEGYRAGSQDMSDLRAGRLTFQTITSNPYRREATR